MPCSSIVLVTRCTLNAFADHTSYKSQAVLFPRQIYKSKKIFVPSLETVLKNILGIRNKNYDYKIHSYKRVTDLINRTLTFALSYIVCKKNRDLQVSVLCMNINQKSLNQLIRGMNKLSCKYI